MGFLQRLSGVLYKNGAKKTDEPESYGFVTNTINNKTGNYINSDNSALAMKLEPVQNPIPESIKDKELAMKFPAKFINKYINKEQIENALRMNPKIKEILKENNLSTDYNLENARSITMSHLIPVAKKAQEIYKKMGHSPNEDNYIYLTQAALLHDIGKIFIPDKILNKKGMLSIKERAIVQLHNLIGYEILSTMPLNQKVATLAFEHHNYDNKINKNQENQALTISDVYCALKEARPYKKPLNDITARTILYDMGTKGKLDTRYINLIN